MFTQHWLPGWLIVEFSTVKRHTKNKLMPNFNQIVWENLNFNRFQVCLAYTYPIDVEQEVIFSLNDYIADVLNGKKPNTTIDEEWTLEKGQTLCLKKGAEIINQCFDDES